LQLNWVVTELRPSPPNLENQRIALDSLWRFLSSK
jgi:hypothetical protein